MQTCCSKKRIIVPIEHDRYLVIGIEIDDKNFPTLSKVSLENPRNKFLVDILFCKGYHSCTIFCYIGTPLQTYSRDLPNFSKTTCQIEFVFECYW